jgi:phospholipid/cholesterol/gamma-HCH transport system substrate-binding protein
MSESRLQGKVGLFLVLGIVLIGVLLLNFSKGASIFTPTYQIRLKAANVGGLKARSAVFVSGVEVGNVMTMELDKDGKTVLLQLKIQKRYPLHRDATFVIEQIGVLGDQFVAIYPGDNSGPLLKDGEEVQARPAFNLQEVARSASELIKRYDKVGESASEAITRLNSQVLDAKTLSNFSSAIGNFRLMSERAVGVMDNVGGIVATNTIPLATTLSNLVRFSARLQTVAADLDDTILTNRAGINASVQNLQVATASLKKIADDLQSGKGLAGGLLKDEQMKADVSVTFSNLAVVSSNLAKYGLLYKPKPPAKPATESRGKIF